MSFQTFDNPVETPIIDENQDRTGNKFFPVLDIKYEPIGKFSLVQFALVETKTKGGLFLPDDTVDVNRSRDVLAKVLGIGSLAFRNAAGDPIGPRERFFYVGEIIRVPQFLSHEWEVKIPQGTVRLGLIDPSQAQAWIKRLPKSQRLTWNQLKESGVENNG